MSIECPEISMIERFVEGDLNGEESQVLAAHASTCVGCRNLLAEVRDNNRIVETVRVVMARTDRKADRDPSAHPESIGPYRILREIGRGGMGIVYEAEQPNPRRLVALKVLHAGLGEDDRIAKMFQREAQALARLRHPSIASIFESGQDACGRAYCTMELVDGLSLTEFARQNRLSTESRLRLFQSVCDAIAYAHQRGVIHRDLKPSNIVVLHPNESDTTSPGVTSGRNHALPKVLDFGLAKVLSSDDAAPDVTLPDEVGRIQGTLPYMSPEQVRGDINEMDTRSDVYSLGVILYELLTGRLPYEINRNRLAESARHICESPPARMAIEGRSIGTDIQTIVFKAMEKEPDRRYSGAAALSEDIERFLDNQPILARPPTLPYQLRKLVGRHRLSAVLSGTMLLLIVGFAASMVVLYARAADNLERAHLAEANADHEAVRARREAEVATRIRDYLVDVFRVADPEIAQGESVTARQLLDRGAARVTEALEDEPAVQATLMQTIGEVYDNLGQYDRAISMLSAALEKRRAIEPDSIDVAQSETLLAGVLQRSGKLDEAASAYQNAHRIMRARGGVGGDVHGVVILQALAEVQERRGDLPGAERALRALVEASRQSEQSRLNLPSTLNALCGVLASQKKYAEGVPLMRESIELTNVTAYGGRTTLLSLRGNLAWLLVQSGDTEEAEPIIREVLDARRKLLPPTHPQIATSLITLGVIHLNKHEPSAAEPVFREALEIHRASLGENHSATAESRGFLGLALIDLKRYEESETELLVGYELLKGNRDTLPSDLKDAAMRLEKLYRAWDRSDDADRWRDKAGSLSTTGAESP